MKVSLIIVFLFLFSVSALPAQKQLPVKQLHPKRQSLFHTCKNTLAQVGADLSKRMPWAPDPKRITSEEYARIRENKVSAYFPNGEITPENGENFLGDFRKLSDNFAVMHLKKGTTRKGKEVAEEIEKMHALLLRSGFLKEHGDKTLETLYLNENFLRGKPPNPRPLTLGSATLLTLGFPFKMAWWGSKAFGVYMFDGFKFGLKTAIGGTLAAAVVYTTIDPVRSAVDNFANQNLRGVQVTVATAVSQVETLFTNSVSHAKKAISQKMTAKEKMEKLTDDLSEINRKYAMKEMEYGEAVKLWEQIIPTLLNYRAEMSSVIPDNIASGRVYYRDANISYPLLFVDSMMTANSELMNHKQLVLLYEAKKRELGSLSEEDEKTLQYHRNELPKSKQRMGAALCAWKVHAILYPEFNRANFMEERPETLPLMRSLSVFEENFRMQDYASEFESEMRRQLKQLGINLKVAENSLGLPESPAP